MSEICIPCNPIKLFAIDFEINCKLPADLFVKYTKARAKQLGLNGWIAEFEPDRYKGRFEGELQNLERIPKFLEELHNFRSQIANAVFGEIQEIHQFSYSNFEIKN